ncbi:hypothetical protein [Rhabdothermincola salaria]|uniref:hypothetical protein n=1 Tax=Rhabdothermincola salaria TaxID=2903142 RepID=UPI001E56F970|nr:hypothetical protein [Rhabdothermincola salaria]MCD9624477.1 hypothetical protein [Rhabdothermincola salaria]
MRKFLVLAAAAALFLGACGSDDGGASLSDDQQEVVDALMASAEEEGFGIDESCVEDVAADLPDEDAAALAATVEGDEEPPSELMGAVGDMFNCIDPDDFVDSIIEDIEASGGTVDADCLRDAFEDVDMGEFITALDSDEPPPAFLEALTSCVQE